MLPIGDMPMPSGFRYRDIFARGKPRHDKTDPFRVRHPSMDPGRRAKLFAPFDALRGFNDAVTAKRELYEEKRILSEEDLEELDRRAALLKDHLPARIRVTFYTPCRDENSDAFGCRGQSLTLQGLCHRVDPEISRCLYLDGERIPLSDIYRIESPEGLFDKAPAEA